MHRCQHSQQVHPPELCSAERPVWSPGGPHIPARVDELVGNVWVQQRQQLGGTRRWKRCIHEQRGYTLELVASGKTRSQQFFNASASRLSSYKETRNRL